MMIPGILMLLIACLYAGLIGFFTFGWYRKKSPQLDATEETATKVSVIVAARNEEKYIIGLLNDLAAQHYPSSLLEILVIDDHSTDKTAEIIAEFINGQKFPCFNLIKNEDGIGKKSAIKAAVSRSTGDLILLTDADCRLGPGWISGMVSYFEDKTKMMISGPVAYFPKKGLLNRFQSLEFSGLMASGSGAAMAGKPFICNGANLAFRKEAFIQVSGYAGNEKFISGDDVFLLHKMKEEFGNQAIGFAKELKTLVLTYPVPGFKAFFKQRIRWASKTRGYHDKDATFTAVIVFLFNLLIITALFGGFWHPGLFFIFGAGILIKSLIDFPLMWGVTGFNAERRLMTWYLPFQVFYPVYVVVAGVLSILPRKKW